MSELVLYRESAVSRDIDPYQYLLRHTLSCQHNMEKLTERVREIYFEQLSIVDDDIPSLERIVSLIDEENAFIVHEFYLSMGWEEEDIDAVLATYNHEISCTLDDYVDEILQGHSMAHTGDPYSAIHSIPLYMTDAQNILIKEFLR